MKLRKVIGLLWCVSVFASGMLINMEASFLVTFWVMVSVFILSFAYIECDKRVNRQVLPIDETDRIRKAQEALIKNMEERSKNNLVS